MANDLSADLEDFVKGGRIKSGYRNLDLITNLYPGFYVLWAVSSLGDVYKRQLQICLQLKLYKHCYIYFIF